MADGVGFQKGLGIAGGVAGIFGSAFGLFSQLRQMKQARAQEAEAKAAIDAYKRQTLRNPYENLRVSTMASDLAREENARNLATSVNAIQSGGVMGTSMIPQLAGQTNTLNRQIGANLDEQLRQNELMKAQGEAQLQQMQEQREMADLQGLGNLMYMGQYNRMQGANAIPNTVLAMGSMMQSLGDMFDKDNNNGDGDTGGLTNRNLRRQNRIFGRGVNISDGVQIDWSDKFKTGNEVADQFNKQQVRVGRLPLFDMPSVIPFYRGF